LFTFLKLVAVVVLIVAAVVLLFGIVGFLAGLFWTLVKFAILAGIVALIAWLVVRKKD
jgi:hypothetical protein